MTRQLKALGLALVGALAMAAFGARRAQCPSSEYMQFAGCPDGKGENVQDTLDAYSKKVSEIEGHTKPFSGSNAMWGSADQAGSLDTRQLTAPTLDNNPHSGSLAVSVENHSQTSSFYEQSKLKDCLA
jgi:hypothetical protein